MNRFPQNRILLIVWHRMGALGDYQPSLRVNQLTHRIQIELARTG
jgi:hypothetical protein